jgi:plasmid maintenance system antidote protein VapI
MGASGQVTNASDKLRVSLRDRGWSVEELAWVLGCSAKATENLMQGLHITPTLALRLEAALEISAGEWFVADTMSVPDLWLLQDQMAGELAGVRWRRHRLSHDRRPEEGCAPSL